MTEPETHKLKIPLSDRDVNKVEIGDLVYFTGQIWTCRTNLQKKVLENGFDLPFSLKNRNVLVHMGPIMRKEGKKWVPKSLTPTTSIRFERFGPRSIRRWNLKAIIGKGTMGKESMKTMKEQNCFHACPTGVFPNKLVKQVKEVVGVYWIEKLGQIEAPWIMKVQDLGPFTVDIDSDGRNLFHKLGVKIEERKKKVYEKLGIPADFEYTLLY